jgi:hypothetical protein
MESSSPQAASAFRANQQRRAFLVRGEAPAEPAKTRCPTGWRASRFSLGAWQRLGGAQAIPIASLQNAAHQIDGRNNLVAAGLRHG